MNWTGATQRDYQTLFALDPAVFTRSILEYRSGVTLLNQGAPGVVSLDESFALTPTEMEEKLSALELKPEAARIFLGDYPAGLKAGRYLPYQAGRLPFADFQFELALSLYPFFGDAAQAEASLEQLRSLTRVAKEVRIALSAPHPELISQTLGPLMLSLHQEDVGVEITPLEASSRLPQAVMVRFWAHACAVR